MQQAQQKLQSSVESLIDRFSNNSLPVQKKGVECSLRCFEQAEAACGTLLNNFPFSWFFKVVLPTPFCITFFEPEKHKKTRFPM